MTDQMRTRGKLELNEGTFLFKCSKKRLRESKNCDERSDQPSSGTSGLGSGPGWGSGSTSGSWAISSKEETLEASSSSDESAGGLKEIVIKLNLGA